MSQSDNNELRDQDQRLVQKLLRSTFSKTEQEDVDIDSRIVEEPVEFRTTTKLEAIKVPADLPHTMNLVSQCLDGAQVKNGLTPPLSPDIDVLNSETVRLRATRLRDFAQGEQASRQSHYDVNVAISQKGIQSLWSVIAQHLRVHHKVPLCVSMPPELASAVRKDIETLYEGAFQNEIPFTNEQGMPVRILVVTDNSLEENIMRCRN